MDKVVEALGKLLPEEHLKEVSSAVAELIEEETKTIKTEAEKNLEQAYEQLSTELAEAEKVGEQGYGDAWAIIEDQNNRIESMKEEFDKMLEEQYEEAWSVIKEEKAKNEDLESRMYEEYDNKLGDMKKYVVGKVDEFLQFKGKEIYEQARRDILNDPRMAEHKVVLDKIVGLTSDYLSEEDLALNTSQKLDAVHGENEQLKTQIKRMEGRNIRLSTENNALGQKLHEAVNLIKEHANDELLTEQKERVKKAANVQGRGKKVLNEGEEIIQEWQNPQVNNNSQQEEGEVVIEGFNLKEMQKLAGLDN
jgi:hypothetical protein